MGDKHVVSISLGSSRRDVEATINIQGQQVRIQRIGTNGDVNQAKRLIKQLDGKIHAFGLGGIDLYIWAGKKRYVFREAQQLAATAEKTPVVDGSGLKNSLERRVITDLHEQGLVPFQDKKILMVCGLDRFGMAEALANTGGQVIYGDLLFVLGLPIQLHSLRALYNLAWLLAPIVTKLPFKWLYPTGSKQDQTSREPKEMYRKLYEWADIIAGDFHLIRRHIPKNLEKKTVITNTVTTEDVQDLRGRGLELLVTTTPSINGRSLGTNLVEAIAVALEGRNMQPEQYLDWLEQVGFQPRIERLQEGQAGQRP